MVIMRSEMMKRFLTALISVILFATILSWISYTPSSQREHNVYYFGFLETFMFVFFYAGPVYLLVGLPLSFFIDKLIGKTKSNSKLTRYSIGLGLYSFVGTLVGFIFVILLTQNVYWSEIISFSIYGFIASIFYYHLSLLLSKINNK
ncbi:hypothetical protein [Lysinibacillus contaminans]|uniref:hypothetical protein n=1 Tax=Lysinibacillus contaminans TaxID=1293441 RepID=UPI000AB3246A|nr:hypothetical protein [Lysinibacillus contaminans]